VRTDGSDSNTGLVDSAGGAFLTIQKAVDVATTLDTGGYAVTVQIKDGTFTAGVSLTKAMTGGGVLTIQGNSGTPANVLISTTSANAIYADGPDVRLTVKDFKITTTTSGVGLYALNGAIVKFTNLNFGAHAGAQIAAQEYAAIISTGGYAVTGGATIHWYARSAFVEILTGTTVTFTGTFAFSVSTAYVQTQSSLQLSGATLDIAAATVTGKRYVANAKALINTNGGGASFIPGNSAGTTADDGLYL
jgi:hypothetical protein